MHILSLNLFTTAAVQSFTCDDAPKPLLKIIREQMLIGCGRLIVQSSGSLAFCAPTLHNRVISEVSLRALVVVCLAYNDLLCKCRLASFSNH